MKRLCFFFRKYRHLGYALPILLTTPALVSSQALEPESHNVKETYQSDFSGSIISFETQLPWRERFTANGAFDSRYSLENSMMDKGMKQAKEKTMDSMQTSSFDAEGVIKDIRLSSGKVKIKHGPIERLGMPGMTMMFNVTDPEMLGNLKKGAKIQFNVENAASGFTVTEIQEGS